MENKKILKILTIGLIIISLLTFSFALAGLFNFKNLAKPMSITSLVFDILFFILIGVFLFFRYKEIKISFKDINLYLSIFIFLFNIICVSISVSFIFKDYNMIISTNKITQSTIASFWLLIISFSFNLIYSTIFNFEQFNLIVPMNERLENTINYFKNKKLKKDQIIDDANKSITQEIIETKDENIVQEQN